MRLSSLLLIGLLGLPLPSQANPSGYTTATGLVYAQVPTSTGTKDLKIDLYLPNGATGPVPCVIWIHGGAWRTGSRVNPSARFLVDYGYAVASIDYRLSQEAVWPAQLHDCKGAVRWLRQNAAQYQLDPDRFGVWGASAGGHLAAMLGTTGDLDHFQIGGLEIDIEGNSGGNLGQSSRVQAVVNWYAPTNFLAMSSFPSTVDHDAPNSPESELIGFPIRQAPVRVALADPVSYLSGDDAPMMLRHGTSDPLVPFQQSEWLFERATESFGLGWDLATVHGGNHGGPGFVGDRTLEFFDEQLNVRPQLVSVLALVSGVTESQPSPSAFRITRAGSTAAPLDVLLHAGGTAKESVDYLPLGRAVRIPAGSNHVDLTLDVLDDGLLEPLETLELYIRPAAAYRISSGMNMAGLTIADDDPATGRSEVSAIAVDGSAHENGDVARIDIVRTAPLGGPLTVQFRLEGTAHNGVDYASVPEQVTIPGGAATATITFTPFADGERESTEWMGVRLERSADYTIGSGRAHARLLEALPAAPLVTVLKSDAACSETPGDGGSFLFSRTYGLGQPLTIHLVVSGTATAGQDYVAFPPSLTFSADELVKRLVVAPIDDNEVEGDETLVLRIVGDSGYQIGLDDKRIMVLVDNDGQVPEDADCRLEAGVMRAGEPWVGTLLDDGPGQPWALISSFYASYEAVPGTQYPVLLDLSDVWVMAAGVLDADGRSNFALEFPDEVGLVGVRFLNQAVTLQLSEPVFELSGRLLRVVTR